MAPLQDIIRNSLYVLQHLPRSEYVLRPEQHPVVQLDDPNAYCDPRIEPITKILLAIWPMPPEEELIGNSHDLYRPYARCTIMTSKDLREDIRFRFCCICGELAEPLTTMRQQCTSLNRNARTFEHFLSCDLPLGNIQEIIDMLNGTDENASRLVHHLIDIISAHHSSVAHRLQRRIDHFYRLFTMRHLTVAGGHGQYRDMLSMRAVEATHLIRRLGILCVQLKKHATP